MSTRAQVQERVAEQRHSVHDDRDQGRERERLVGGAQVDAAALDEAPAHRQPDADRRAREQERGDAGGAGDDPEEVLFHGGHAAPATFERPQRKLGISRERAPSITLRRRTATNIPTAPQIASEREVAPSTLAPGTKQAENASTRCLSGKKPGQVHQPRRRVGDREPHARDERDRQERQLGERRRLVGGLRQRAEREPERAEARRAEHEHQQRLRQRRRVDVDAERRHGDDEQQHDRGDARPAPAPVSHAPR